MDRTRHSVRRTAVRVALGVALAAALGGCGGGMSGDGSTTVSPGGGSGGASAPVTPPPCAPASASGGPYCLIFVGSAFGIHIGQQFKVALVSADGNNTVIAHATLPALSAAAFFVEFPQAMQAGVPYYVDYYVDATHNGICDPPLANGSSDHVWRSHTYISFTQGTIRTVTAAAGDFTWSVVHDDPWITDPVGNNTCPQLNSF